MSNEHDSEGAPQELNQILDTPELAEALENERFKQFLDHLPIAIAVSECGPQERIVYANPMFLELIQATSLVDCDWSAIPGKPADETAMPLGDAITSSSDFVGTFAVGGESSEPRSINVWSNIIEDDEGNPAFRLLALVALPHDEAIGSDAEQKLREKDTLLRELQHRVKNNLQMITAIIRIEARQASADVDRELFERLAGRVEALALLYDALSASDKDDEVDLGSYVSHIASAAMQAQAAEGVRLELAADTWLVPLNVALPTGLVVNELVTNALKYAFRGRETGTISVKCLVDDAFCKVVIADDGVGLPLDREWPEPGKLSSLIVRSLRENAHAQIKVETRPEMGTTVTILFTVASAENA